MSFLFRIINPVILILLLLGLNVPGNLKKIMSLTGSLKYLAPDNYELIEDLLPFNALYYFLIVALIITLFSIEFRYWNRNFKNLSWKNEYNLFIGATIVSLIVVEVTLRKVGFEPGKYYINQWFHKVDSLKFKKGFYADQQGIFKVDSIAAENIKNEIESQYHFNINHEEWNIPGHREKEIYALVKDFMEVHLGKLNNEFTQKYFEITKKEKEHLNSLESAILKYSFSPINKDGFRSIEFNTLSQGSKTILLLGDSHTWGHSTSNKTNSFADILLAKGYTVFNTGISGADPAQYLAIAKEYIPKLNPDVVVLNVFLGNDIIYYKRIPEHNKPILFSTNAGKLMSVRYGEMRDANTIYNQSVISTYLPEKGFISNVCRYMVFTSLIYTTLEKFLFIMPDEEKLLMINNDLKKPALEEPSIIGEIAEIASLSREYNTELYVCLLPEVRYKSIVTIERYKNDLPNENYHIPNLTREHYQLSDGHLNDVGHREYAQFLIDLIESK